MVMKMLQYCLSGLNPNKPIVIILENQYIETKRELELFIRNAIILGSFNLIFTIIGYILIHNYISAVIMSLCSVCIYIHDIRHTIAICNLKHIGELRYGQFDNVYTINEADVINTVFKLCETRGIIMGHSKFLRIHTLLSSLMVIMNVIYYFINFLN